MACRRSRTPGGKSFYVISDDQANARFYKLRAKIADGELDNDDITFTSVTTLEAARQDAVPDRQPRPRGVHALTQPGGHHLRGLREPAHPTPGSTSTGSAPAFRDVPVSSEFNPNAAGTQGVRLNLYEAAATLGKHLYTGTENALVQDGPAASLTAGARCAFSSTT